MAPTAIAVGYNPTTSNIILEYNSFLSTDMIALRLNEGGNAHLNASNNYWNTTDTNVIDSMIWDRNDTLECVDYINYQPFLTSPHPDTPILPPIADFTGSPTSGPAPTTVNFNDQSTGTITSWEWAFGDDNATSTEQNPTHIYNVNPGSLYRKPHRSLGTEGSDTETKVDYITVTPSLSITASAGAGGTIIPSGSLTVPYGADQSYTITPNTGYQVADVLVDGSSVGAVTSYTFTHVTENHTIEATFTDYDLYHHGYSRC